MREAAAILRCGSAAKLDRRDRGEALMNIILLSGGSGKRLWPLSNDVRSKQFLMLFQNDAGEYESMVQRVYRQISTVDPSAAITIATGSVAWNGRTIRCRFGTICTTMRQLVLT